MPHASHRQGARARTAVCAVRGGIGPKQLEWKADDRLPGLRLASKSLAHRFCLSDRIEENLKSQFLPLLQRVGEVVVKANKMMPRACC